MLQRDVVLLERVTHMYTAFLLSSMSLSSILALDIMTSYMDSGEPDSVATHNNNDDMLNVATWWALDNNSNSSI